MNNYVIFTDLACDITTDILKGWNVKSIPLSFIFDGSREQYYSEDMSVKDFYNIMRTGGVARTSAINSEIFRETFEAELKNGSDVIYIAFSSGLSNTCNNAGMVAEELMKVYPDRKVIVVDSLAASGGYGLLVYFASKKRDEGATAEELEQYIISIRNKLCHWFTVDDLVYLKRGGRVSATKAFVGGVLGIKPVLHVDEEGHLINVSKARGRKASVKALAEKFGELAIDVKDTVFISNGDCKEDAEDLESILREKYGAVDITHTDIGPIIGAHAGPGTLALFFLGEHK